MGQRPPAISHSTCYQPTSANSGRASEVNVKEESLHIRIMIASCITWSVDVGGFNPDPSLKMSFFLQVPLTSPHLLRPALIRREFLLSPVCAGKEGHVGHEKVLKASDAKQQQQHALKTNTLKCSVSRVPFGDPKSVSHTLSPAIPCQAFSNVCPHDRRLSCPAGVVG